MKSNKTLIQKIFITGVILLVLSTAGFSAFVDNGLNTRHHYGISQAILLLLTILNGSVFAYGLSLSRRFKYTDWSVLYTLALALILIGYAFLMFLTSFAAGFHDINFKL